MKTKSAVYGISTLLTLPVQMVNIPFYEFITANPENGFASANYILGRLKKIFKNKNFDYFQFFSKFHILYGHFWQAEVGTTPFSIFYF